MPRPKTGRLAQGRLPAALTLVVGLALSFAAFQGVRRSETLQGQQALDRAADDHVTAIRSELGACCIMMQVLRAFHAASLDVEREEFREFTAPLLRNVPGIQALAWIPRVPASGREALEADARRDGLAGFRITERSAQGEEVPAGDRAEYFPVFYMESRSPQRPAAAALPGTGAAPPNGSCDKARTPRPASLASGQPQAPLPAGRQTEARQGKGPGPEAVPPDPAAIRTGSEPADRGLWFASLGLDVGVEPLFREALAQAGGSGNPAATPRFGLGQEPGDGFGFLQLLPVYRKGAGTGSMEARRENLAGFFLGVFRIGDLVETALAPLAPAAVNLLIQDRSAPDAGRFLYARSADGRAWEDARPAGHAHAPDTESLAGRSLHVAGRQWSVWLIPTPEFLQANRTLQPFIVLFLGLLCTGVVATFLAQNARGHARLSRINEALRQEIRDRRRAEADRMVSESRFRALFLNAPVGIGVAQADGKRVMENDALLAMLGLTRGEAPPDDVRVHYCDLQDWTRTVHDVRSAGLVRDQEIRMCRKDGTEFLARVTLVLFPVGGVEQVVGVMEDITERKETEKTLRMLETAVAQSNDGIVVLDDRGHTRFCNPAWAEMHGYTVPEVLGKPLTLFHTVAQFEEDVVPFNRQAILHGRAVAEVKHTRKDGTAFSTLLRSTMMRDGEGRTLGFVTIATDITEKRKWEEELSKVQRLESLGMLAGGIAHDFNNILTAILSNISMARIFGDLPEDFSEMLSDAERATLRARGLTHQLLAFAKGGAPVKKSLCVSRLLRETVKFSLSGSSVHCQYDLPDDLWPVEGDEAQLGQVVQNLIINADQAMAEGGTLRVSAENVTREEGTPGSPPPGRYVKITVEDQGSGIPEKLLPKIFDPFFTTKEKGRGLGLATSFSIVNRHGGHIRVDSRMGTGTRVDVFLPATRKRPPADVPVRAEPGQGRGRVLLIDDDETIRKSTGEVLKRLGYEVVSAWDGREGIGLYEEARTSGNGFHVVIMDLTIPGGMGGREAVKALLEIDPEARVVASSGYSDAPVMARYKEFGFRAVVNKPYKMGDLGEALRKAMS